MAPHPKGQPITDPVVLERLQKARVKALETRRRKAQEKKDMKLAEDLESRKKVNEARDKIKKTLNIDDEPSKKEEPPKEDPPTYEEATKKEETPAPNLKKSPTKQDLKEEDEPEVEYIKVPKKTKPKKKKIVYVEEESSDSEEEEVEYVKKKPKKKSQQPPKEEPPTAPPREKFDYPRQSPQETLLDNLYRKYYGR